MYKWCIICTVICWKSPLVEYASWLPITKVLYEILPDQPPHIVFANMTTGNLHYLWYSASAHCLHNFQPPHPVLEKMTASDQISLWYSGGGSHHILPLQTWPLVMYFLFDTPPDQSPHIVFKFFLWYSARPTTTHCLCRHDKLQYNFFMICCQCTLSS